jgi:hypothetical protein
VGGVEDHVHLAVELSRTITIANLVKKLKQTSSVWIKEQSGAARNFEWQAGYGVFSLGQSQFEDLLKYIDGQESTIRRSRSKKNTSRFSPSTASSRTSGMSGIKRAVRRMRRPYRTQ